MKISEISPGQKGIEIEANITEISPIREFSRFGNNGRVANALVEDDSGKIQLTLWDDQIDKLKQGDRIKITDAYAKEFRGMLQISISRKGTLEVL